MLFSVFTDKRAKEIESQRDRETFFVGGPEEPVRSNDATTQCRHRHWSNIVALVCVCVCIEYICSALMFLFRLVCNDVSPMDPGPPRPDCHQTVTTCAQIIRMRVLILFALPSNPCSSNRFTSISRMKATDPTKEKTQVPR